MLPRKALFLLITALALTACGPSNKNTNAAGPTLHVWIPSLGAASDSVFVKLVQTFERENTCTVRVHRHSDLPEKELLDSIRTNDSLDVLVTNIESFSFLADHSVLAAYSASDSLERRFLPGTLHSVQWKGALYGLPWLVNTRVLFGNTTMASALTTSNVESQEDLLDVCESIGSQESTGWGTHSEDPGRLIYSLMPFIWSYGGDIVINDSVVSVNSPQNIRALTQYVELSRTGKLETERQLDAEFIHGSIGLWFGNTSLLREFSSEGHAQRVKAILFPGAGKYSGTSVITGLAIGVASQSRQQLLARRFTEMLTSNQAMQVLTDNVQSPFPAITSVLIEMQHSAGALRGIICDQLMHARTVPSHPRWRNVAQLFEQAVRRLLYGELDPSEALDDIEKHVQDTEPS